MKTLKVYENGLTLVYYYMPVVRSVAIGVYVKVGSVNESAQINGISHFIEHMNFKGTKTRTAFEIANSMDRIGAQINAFTSKTNTCFYTVSIDSDAEKCAELLSDLYFNSTYPEDEMEKEKGVVCEEISMTEDLPDDLCVELATQNFYKGHPLARPILGSRKNVIGFKRADLFDYTKRHYTADNTVISVVGNIEFDKVESLLNRYFMPNFNDNKVDVLSVNPAKTHAVFGRKVKHIEQSHLAFVYPSVGYTHPLEAAIKVMNTAFGYGMSSRLFQNIRERKGLAYSVYSYPSFYDSEGYLLIYAGTNHQSAEKAAQAIGEEVGRLADGLTDDELASGRAQMKSAYVLGQESSANLMMLFGKHAVMTGKLLDIDERLAAIDGVTQDDIHKAVEQIFVKGSAAGFCVGADSDVDLLKYLNN